MAMQGLCCVFDFDFKVNLRLCSSKNSSYYSKFCSWSPNYFEGQILSSSRKSLSTLMVIISFLKGLYRNEGSSIRLQICKYILFSMILFHYFSNSSIYWMFVFKVIIRSQIISFLWMKKFYSLVGKEILYKCQFCHA